MHHRFTKNRRLLVILKSGERFIDRFVESKGNRCITLKSRGRFYFAEIKVLTVYRPDRDQGRQDAD